MKPISVHVPEQAYDELKSLAARRGVPTAELIRQAMLAYLERTRQQGRSVVALAPHESGRLLAGWSRHELMDEMRQP